MKGKLAHKECRLLLKREKKRIIDEPTWRCQQNPFIDVARFCRLKKRLKKKESRICQTSAYKKERNKRQALGYEC